VRLLKRPSHESAAASKEYQWTFIGCERIDPVNPEKDYGDSLNDLIDRASDNPRAVIYGSFHTYPTNN
jgi:hypothetical protein